MKANGERRKGKEKSREKKMGEKGREVRRKKEKRERGRREPAVGSPPRSAAL